MSVEVKTTGAARGPAVHRVQSPDQLASPGTGALYLLSVRAVSDPLGGHNLDVLVGRAGLAADRAGGSVPDDVDERLAAAGWSLVDDGRWTESFRVVSQSLFHVDGTFPRPRRRRSRRVCPRLTDVSYTLDVSACDEWNGLGEHRYSGWR